MEKQDRERRPLSANSRLPPRVRAMIEEIRTACEEGRQALIDSERSAVGPVVWDALVSSPEQALLALADPSAIVRQAALFAAMKLHQPTTSVVDRCRQLAESDPDDEVREAAIVQLARYREGSKDRELLAFLSGLVQSSQEPVAIRMVAYRAMIAVVGQRLTWEPPTFHLVNLRDVDWGFVRTHSAGS